MAQDWDHTSQKSLPAFLYQVNYFGTIGEGPATFQTDQQIFKHLQDTQYLISFGVVSALLISACPLGTVAQTFYMV